jgi:hypothetical protein
MAKETITVHPDHVQESMDEHQIFGWDVLSNQEVKTVDSHLEDRGGDLYSVTKTEHYIRLTYQRDLSSIPHYQELAALDKEYFAVPSPGRRSKLFSKFSLVILGLGLLLIIGGFTQIEYGGSVLGYFLFGVAIIALRVFFHIRKNKKWDNEFAVYLKKREEIVEKAKGLQNYCSVLYV